MDDQPIASSSTSPNNILPVLLSLPVSHPAHLELLKSHSPFNHPSHLDAAGATKYLNRLNQSILARDDVVARRAGCELARAVIEQDEEGWVLNGWGKGWIGACLGAISTQNVALGAIISPIQLLQAIVLEAKGYPGFERDAVQPVMGKLAVTINKLLEQCISGPQRPYDVLYDLLISIRELISHSPASWRPSIPSLRSHLIPLILHAPVPPSIEPVACPHEVRRAAADLLAVLHLCSGKANSSASWTSDLKDALGGLGASLSAITAEGFREEPPRVASPPTTSLPPLPADPTIRLPIALEFVEGYNEIMLSFLRFPTSRPVSVPLSGLVSAALRCLNLTFATPMVEHASPTHRAALLASLPRLWTAGLLLLAGTAAAVADNILPHLSEILDHAVFLSETIPLSMVASHLSLLCFFRLWLGIYPAAILPVDYVSRLLKTCLGRLSPLLEKRPATVVAESGKGKRGKKRARGMEDGLVAGLEGKTADRIGEEGRIALEALRLIPLLHQAPLLPPALLTFSIRLHLSLYLNLDTLSGRFTDPVSEDQVRAAVKHVLSEAVLLSEEEGTQRGWKSVILGVLDDTRGKFNLLLHPSLPPIHRPAPPLSSLHFFAPESEEEKRLRQELGFAIAEDLSSDNIAIDPPVPGIHSHTRRRSDAGELHVSHSAAQVVPSAMITIPREEKEQPRPIIIEPGPVPSSSFASAAVGATPNIGMPAGLAAGSVDTHPPAESFPNPLEAQPTSRALVQGGPEGLEPTPQAAAPSFAGSAFAATSGSSSRVPAPLNRQAVEDEEDEGIPELDSGSSDEDGMDEDHAEDEDLE